MSPKVAKASNNEFFLQPLKHISDIYIDKVFCKTMRKTVCEIVFPSDIIAHDITTFGDVTQIKPILLVF
jgi:hypothetical protein